MNDTDICPHCGRLIKSRGWLRHEQKCAMNPAIRQRLLTIIDDGYGRLRKAKEYDRIRRASHADLPCSYALINAFGDSWDSVADGLGMIRACGRAKRRMN